MAPDFIAHKTLGTAKLTAEQRHRLYVARRIGQPVHAIKLADPLPEIDPSLAAIAMGRWTPGSASGAPLAQ